MLGHDEPCQQAYRCEVEGQMTGTTEPAQEECSRFQDCCCNQCPLNSRYKELKSFTCDPQHECKMRKSARYRIGLKYNLKNFGLKGRESIPRPRVEGNGHLAQDDTQIIYEKKAEIGPGAILEEGKGGKRA